MDCYREREGASRMDLIAGSYGDDDDRPAAGGLASTAAIEAAPDVSPIPAPPGGGALAAGSRHVAAPRKNHRLGNVRTAFVSDYGFKAQQTQFHTTGTVHGVAVAAGGGRTRRDGGTLDRRPRKVARVDADAPPAEEEREEPEAEDPFEWRPPTTPWQEKRYDDPVEYTEEEKRILAAQDEPAVEVVAVEPAVAKQREDKSFFHGKSERDYAGRSWVEPPRGPREQWRDRAFVPKRKIHTWGGHASGVNAIRFFPTSGHLLLSAGVDTKVKVWDVNGTGKCMRTYLGHSKAVRDICFSNDGRRFLSAGYDRKIKLWDTETGQVISTLGQGAIPFCCKFNPADDQQNMVLAGCSDNKIYQFDLDSGDVVQEYSEHLGSVNALAFIDDNRRFISSSDDRTLRVWDFGIPVQIKYIASPEMHSVPALAAHPTSGAIACSSMDNTVKVYNADYKQAKRTFRGHNVAGHSCQVNFSPDGIFLISGDAEGRCFVWDWKTTRAYRILRAHEGVCKGVEWNPAASSRIATCGLDGKIHYFD